MSKSNRKTADTGVAPSSSSSWIPSDGASTSPSSSIGFGIELVAGIMRRLRHYQRYVLAGRQSMHTYHTNGMYGIRTYMCMLTRYAHAEEGIARVRSSVAQCGEKGGPGGGGDGHIQRLRKDVVDLRRELTSLVRYGGLVKLSAVLSYFLRGESIYEYCESDPHNRCEVLLRHFHTVHCSTRKGPPTRSCTSNWMAVEALPHDIIDAQYGQMAQPCVPHVSNTLLLHVHGCRLHFYDHATNRLLTLDGYVDNIDASTYEHPYVAYKMSTLRACKKMKTRYYMRMLATMSLRDALVHDKNTVLQHYSGVHNRFKAIKQQKISQTIMLFDKGCTYDRYRMIHMFMLDVDASAMLDSSYIAYLLYDLLSTNTMSTLDTNEQRQVFDCFVYQMKMSFKQVMHSTVEYTRRIMDLDHESIPYEQQICLMKCSDYVKQKAMVKFKEIKGRSDDSSCKAKQYLDGLLRIPFGQYYTEDIMRHRHENIDLYRTLVESYNTIAPTNGSAVIGFVEDRVTNADITRNIDSIRTEYCERLKTYVWGQVGPAMHGIDRETLTTVVCKVNGMLKASAGACGKKMKIRHSGKTKEYMVKELMSFVGWCIENHATLLLEVTHLMNVRLSVDYGTICTLASRISENTAHISRYMRDVGRILDDAVYGHEEAKSGMQRVIAQWINGEPSGRCLGFEGPPGCGKTSFAKNGVARCLCNADGRTRPFAFVALGGSSNASFLEGHSYTYVGSTWGKVVDILIENKCMNPIIFIDELDKISRTEYGKEINGILTHLIDSTQNSEFYDKYFAGVPLDLSRVLFIFSYNDVSQIDKVVLDRIHRIRFDALSLEDKLVVVRRHMLPQLLREVGLEGHVEMSDEVVEYIIMNHTRESGVRKLKELLYEVVSEINLAYLKDSESYSLPHVVTVEELRASHFRDKAVYNATTPSAASLVGVVNGLWANALKEGGILPIEARLFPTDTFLEFKLTGNQGDVMRESMNVAKTVVWSSLLTAAQRAAWSEQCKATRMQGLHVHCPEGATPKDGPSAGAAITLALYSAILDAISLWGKETEATTTTETTTTTTEATATETATTETKVAVMSRIRPWVALTGEINLRGEIGEIGGLESKILGGLSVGIREFLYPSANERDFERFKTRHPTRYDPSRVTFRSVSHIREVVDCMLVSSA